MKFLRRPARLIGRGVLFILRAVPAVLETVATIAALASIVYGVWQIHQPSAWIVGGVIGFMGCFWYAASNSAAVPKPPPVQSEDT